MKTRMALLAAAALGLASLAGVAAPGSPAQPAQPAGINCPPPPGARVDSLCVDGGTLPDGEPPVVDD